MRFIKELIAAKSWNNGQAAALDRESLENDLQEGGFDSPLVARKHAETDAEEWPEEDEFFADGDAEPEQPAMLEEPADPQPEEPDMAAQADAVAESGDALELEFELDEDEEPDDWDIGLEPDDLPEQEVLDKVENSFEEPDSPDHEIDLGLEEDALHQTEVPAGSPKPEESDPELSELDLESDLGFDEEESLKIEQVALEAVETDEELSEDEKAALVHEIRLAMDSVRHIRSDADMGRLAAARDELGRDAGYNGRIFEETDTILAEDTGARRRKAIALMKAAVAATRADPKLQSMVGRDPSGDPTEQRDYREDLEDMKPPRLEPSKARNDRVDMSEETEAEQLAQPDDLDAAPATPDAGQIDNDGAIDSQPDGGNSWFTADDVETEDEPQDQPEMHDLRAALLAPEPASPGADDDPSASDEANNRDEPDSVWNAWDSPDEPASDQDAAETAEAPVAQVPTPALGRAGRGAGRVKTRLLGFQQQHGGPQDVIGLDGAVADGPVTMFPVGWLVVVDGHGKGHSFALSAGVSQIGRGDDQTVRMDFGDTSISRQNHAAIAYDDEQNCFYLGHGGKSNLVRLNGKPVLATEELHSNDEIRIGETRLVFIALCGPEFSWRLEQEGPQSHAAIA